MWVTHGAKLLESSEGHFAGCQSHVLFRPGSTQEGQTRRVLHIGCTLMIKRGSGLQLDPACPTHPLHLEGSQVLGAVYCCYKWGQTCLPLLMGSKENRQGGKCGCHAWGCIGKGTAVLTARLQPHKEGKRQVGDRASTSGVLGQCVSETAGRCEMLLKVGRCLSWEGSSLSIGTMKQNGLKHQDNVRSL